MTQAKRFAMTITGAPDQSDQPARALRFAQALHNRQHTLEQVFFYGNGVQCSQDRFACKRAWEALQQKTQCALYVCVSAAERRGIRELSPPWQLVGLGDWVAGMDTEHHLHFGD